MRKVKNKKVVVAMSGGVDSSVTAALLKKDGFEVIGVFMRLWITPGKKKWDNRPHSSEAENRAKSVAKALDIPFYVLTLKKEFKKNVVDYFLSEYKGNKTPNPCVVCNKKIKFGLFLEKALSLKADFIATGHYVRICPERDSGQKKKKYRLLAGKDKNKDQSYFLWQLNQRQLSHILFPVGRYTKEEVRKMAKRFNLPVNDAPESQEICFIQTTIGDFLKKYFKPIPGKIISAKGKILGEHQGLYFYTIGQRKGIALPISQNKGALSRPWYVLAKNPKKNQLIVSQNQKDLMKKGLIAKKVNWISGQAPKGAIEAKAKIRYGFLHRAVSAKIIPLERKRVRVVFRKPQRAITPGQSVVFYQRSELLGGGIIA